MLLRLITGVGLFALGYYLGREVGRMAPVREELQRARDQDDAEDDRSLDAEEDDTPSA
jgi:hypothetical protein